MPHLSRANNESDAAGSLPLPLVMAHCRAGREIASNSAPSATSRVLDLVPADRQS